MGPGPKTSTIDPRIAENLIGNLFRRAIFEGFLQFLRHAGKAVGRMAPG